jgi:hypothetical protein
MRNLDTLMTASLRSEKLAQSTDESASVGGKHYNLLLAGVLSIASGALAIWCCFDHSLPSWDAGGHLLNGLSYQELFRHPHPLQLQWWHHLLTVNCFYPPLTYVVSGLVKTIVGTGLWTDSLMKVLFLTVLNIGVFGLVDKLTKDKLAAIFAVILVNLYPEVAVESHKSMLDFAVMAMTAVALAALANWQEKPDLKRTVLLAVATSCALLTKQVCAAFLLLPFALYALIALKQRRFKNVAMLVSAGLAAGATLIPWLIVSAPTIKRVAAEIQISLGNKNVSDVFASNVISYFGFLPVMATPFLLGVGCIAIVLAKRETHRQLTMLSLSLLSGTLLLSTLTWQYALPRYFLSALIVFAAYSGCLLSALWRNGLLNKDSSSSHSVISTLSANTALKEDDCNAASLITAGNTDSHHAQGSLTPIVQSGESRGTTSSFRKHVQKGLVAFVLAGGMLGYIAVNFYPFPITTSSLLETVRVAALRPVSAQTKGRSEHPCSAEDWGIMWALSKVSETDGNSPVWLNVLPSTQQLNVHAFEYFGRQAKFQVHPTTSRSWSAAGDSSKFSEEDTLHYTWYLTKNGEQGFKFHDTASRANFDRLIDFISNGEHFVLKGEKLLPDGSQLRLYRQK